MKKENKVNILRKSILLKNGKVLQVWTDKHMNNVLIIKDKNSYVQIGIIYEKLNRMRKRDVKKSIVWMFQSISLYVTNGELKIKFIKENNIIVENYKNLNISFNTLTENTCKNGFVVLGKPKKQGLKLRFPMDIGKITALL